MTWERARLGGELCGRCGVVVAEQMPLRAIYLADGRLRKVRCPACAGEPVNEAELAAAARARDWDLTMSHKVCVPSQGPVPLSTIAKDRPFDPKQAQTGEKADDWLGADEWTREPGEEG